MKDKAPRSDIRQLLIVDDERLFCDAVKTDLDGPTLQGTTAHTLAEARPVCQTIKFDVVLVDNRLPDGSGLTLVSDILNLIAVFRCVRP